VPTRREAVARRLAALLVLVPALAAAQVPGELDSGRTRLRDRYRTPQNNQKLDENLRKLKSEDPTERLEAIQNLGELTDPKAVESIVGAASDPDMRIRVKAIDTLGVMKAKDATPLLVQQLFMRDTDLGTKRHILATLGRIGDERATPSLVTFLARDVDPAARGNAIFALGDIGDRSALPALEKVAKDTEDDNVRGLAQEAIRKIRTRPEPSVVPPALAVDQRGPGAPTGRP
jgi:HEAT repeat protein